MSSPQTLPAGKKRKVEFRQEMELIQTNRVTNEGRPVFADPQGNERSEVSITVTNPRIREGRPTNIPSLVGGKMLTEEDAIEAAIGSKLKDPITGREFQSFGTIGEAVTAAKARSKSLTIMDRAELSDVVSPLDESHQDTEILMEQHAQLREDERLRKLMEDLAAQDATIQQEASQDPATPAGEPQKPDVSLGGIAKDVGRGITEIPTQTAGGVVDTLDEASVAFRDISEFIFGGLTGTKKVVVDSETMEIKIAGGEEDVETLVQAITPNIPEAASTTGAAVRTIVSFGLGFAGAGKFKPIQALAKARGGTITAGAAKGAIADFTVFEAHEERLANVVKELGSPFDELIPDFLEADPQNSEVGDRLRAAVEGLGLGAVADGLMGGIRVVRAARRAKRLNEQVEDAVTRPDSPIEQVLAKADRQEKRIEDLLGDPSAPLVDVNRLTRIPDAEDEAAGVFINWARINSDEDVQLIVQRLADDNAAGIDTARRGRRTHAETVAAAEQEDAWQILNERRKGEPLNAEKSVAARELWIRSGEKVRDLAQEVIADPDSVMAQLALRKHVATHRAIQEQVLGARAETARALNAWRIPVGGDRGLNIAQMDEIESVLRQETQSTLTIAQGIQDLSEKGLIDKLDSFVYGTFAARTSGMFRQLWYFSLLSGPHTHARNGISNTAVGLQQVYERKAANLLGRALHGKPNIPDGETWALAGGMIDGWRDAFRIGAQGESPFTKAFRTGESSFGATKLPHDVAENLGAFNPERLGVGRDTKAGRILSFIDGTTRLPTRALAASDEAYKASAAKSELGALAHRQAVQEVESGALAPGGFMDRVTQLTNEPSEQMTLASRLHAETVTFTNQPGRDSKIFRAMESIGNIPVIGRLILPFKRTPYNLANYAFARTPLALGSKRIRAQLAKGGAEGDLAMTRVLTGTSLMMVFADMAMRGQITGEGPIHRPAEMATMRRGGWRPWSIRVGDEWFSYRGLEPIATHIGIVANMTELLSHEDFGSEDKAMTDVAVATALAIADQLTSQQYMSGVSAFIEALSNSRRYGPSYFRRLSGAVVPTGVAQLNRTLMDPFAREIFNEMDAIKNRTPGFSKDVPFKRDLWGRPLEYGSSLGKAYDFFIPIYGSPISEEPVDQELLRLNAPMGRPDTSQTFEGVKVNMRQFPQAYSRFVELAGNAMTHHEDGTPIDHMTELGTMDSLNLLVTGQHPLSVVYDQEVPGQDLDGPEGVRAMMIKKRIQLARVAARKQVLNEFPDLRAKVDATRLERGEMILP